MTPRQKRRFMRQFNAQVERERNGAPVDGEVAARMTAPKGIDPMFQVVVTTKDGRMLPVGPMWLRPCAEEFAATVNRFVAEGKERTWTSAAVVPLTPLPAGAN